MDTSENRCAVCSAPPNDPICISECGHSLCRVCLDDFAAEKASAGLHLLCPICGEEFRYVTKRPAPVRQQELRPAVLPIRPGREVVEAVTCDKCDQPFDHYKGWRCLSCRMDLCGICIVVAGHAGDDHNKVIRSQYVRGLTDFHKQNHAFTSKKKKEILDTVLKVRDCCRQVEMETVQTAKRLVVFTERLLQEGADQFPLTMSMERYYNRLDWLIDKFSAFPNCPLESLASEMKAFCSSLKDETPAPNDIAESSLPPVLSPYSPVSTAITSDKPSKQNNCTPTRVRSNTRRNENSPSLTCKLCAMEFSSVRNQEEHEKHCQHSVPITSLTDSAMSAESNSLESLGVSISHTEPMFSLKTVDQQTLYCCNICRYVSSRKKGIIAHVSCHTSTVRNAQGQEKNDELEERHCTGASPDNTRLLHNQPDDDNVPSYQIVSAKQNFTRCKLCGRMAINLKAHLRRRHFACTVCFSTFKSEAGRTHHATLVGHVQSDLTNETTGISQLSMDGVQSAVTPMSPAKEDVTPPKLSPVKSTNGSAINIAIKTAIEKDIALKLFYDKGRCKICKTVVTSRNKFSQHAMLHTAKYIDQIRAKANVQLKADGHCSECDVFVEGYLWWYHLRSEHKDECLRQLEVVSTLERNSLRESISAESVKSDNQQKQNTATNEMLNKNATLHQEESKVHNNQAEKDQVQRPVKPYTVVPRQSAVAILQQKIIKQRKKQMGRSPKLIKKPGHGRPPKVSIALSVGYKKLTSVKSFGHKQKIKADTKLKEKRIIKSPAKEEANVRTHPKTENKCNKCGRYFSHHGNLMQHVKFSGHTQTVKEVDANHGAKESGLAVDDSSVQDKTVVGVRKRGRPPKVVCSQPTTEAASSPSIDDPDAALLYKPYSQLTSAERLLRQQVAQREKQRRNSKKREQRRRIKTILQREKTLRKHLPTTQRKPATKRRKLTAKQTDSAQRTDACALDDITVRINESAASTASAAYTTNVTYKQ